MKKLLMIFLLALPFAAFSQTQGGYTASYSSKFKMGEASYADKVLTLWKDFENNTLDKHADWIADTVTMQLSGGSVVKGRANSLAGAKEFRSSLTNYKVDVEAWMSLKSTDRNQNWVAIWGTEEYTDKDGKQVKVRLHEIWGFNSDGKISIMMQYAGM